MSARFHGTYHTGAMSACRLCNAGPQQTASRGDQTIDLVSQPVAERSRSALRTLEARTSVMTERAPAKGSTE